MEVTSAFGTAALQWRTAKFEQQERSPHFARTHLTLAGAASLLRGQMYRVSNNAKGGTVHGIVWIHVDDSFTRGGKVFQQQVIKGLKPAKTGSVSFPNRRMTVLGSLI